MSRLVNHLRLQELNTGSKCWVRGMTLFKKNLLKILCLNCQVSLQILIKCSRERTDQEFKTKKCKVPMSASILLSIKQLSQQLFLRHLVRVFHILPKNWKRFNWNLLIKKNCYTMHLLCSILQPLWRSLLKGKPHLT